MGVGGVEDLSPGIRIGQQVVAAAEMDHDDDRRQRPQDRTVHDSVRVAVPAEERENDRGDTPCPEQDDDRHREQADAPLGEKLCRQNHGTAPQGVGQQRHHHEGRNREDRRQPAVAEIQLPEARPNE